jgi:ribosome biogenesis GTPase / thiamine phosphate phosphatase
VRQAAHGENSIVRELTALGFGPFFKQQLQPSDGSEPILARIAAEHRNAYEVWSAKGTGSAQLSGRLRTDVDALPCVGDWVILKSEPAADRAATIERVLARRTEFTRGAAGRRTRVQAVASNIDLAFAVCGLDADFNLHRIERYVARIWASGARPSVVLNKADICENGAARAAEVGRRCSGVPVLVTSALLLEGIASLRTGIREGETAVFVGSSGAGKSSLINALIGENRMPTGEVRRRDGRGCHVTTHRQLVLLPGGGLLLDTPGMRELQLVDDKGLDAVFEDIAALSARCRFRDCRHDAEPGCAVKEAVRSGKIAAERLEHYRKLEREAEAGERRRDVRLRRQDERAWGRLCNQAVRLRRLKENPD